LRKSCISEKTKFKKLDNSIYKLLYDAIHDQLQSLYAKRALKKSSSTVEPGPGTMLNFLNLKRLNARGIKQAMKHVLMSALTYNLKKYMHVINRIRTSVSVALDFQALMNKMKVVFNIFLLRPVMATHIY
jgi:hypothetical protein